MSGRTLDLLFGLPLLGAFLVLFAPRQWATAIRRFAVLVTLAELALATTLLRGSYPPDGALAAVSSHGYVWELGMGVRFGVDGISAALVLLTALITPIALATSWSTVTTKVKEHALCFLLLEAGLVGAFMSTDLFFFYICWELVLVPLYLLIGIWGGGDKALTSTKFFLYTLAGSLVMLVAVLYVGTKYASLARHPSYALADLRSLVLPLEAQALLFAAFALAFAIKMPLFPLHTWSPETYRDAPTSVAMMASAVVAKLGAYGLLRWAVGLFPLGAQLVGPTIAVLAVVGLIYGALAAWAQRDLKTLLAYTSMSHMAYIAIGIFAMTDQGATGAVMQMVSHGITTAGLFLLVGAVEARTGTRELASLSGLAKDRPRFTLLFVLIALAATGVPGTSGFVGEFLVILGAFESSIEVGYHIYGRSFGATTALGMIFGAIYILHMLRRVLWGPARAEDAGKPDLTTRELVCLAPIAVLVVVIGVFPGFAIERISPAISAWRRSTVARHGAATRATVPYLPNPELAAGPVVAPAPPRAAADPHAVPADGEAPSAPRRERARAVVAPLDPAPVVPIPHADGEGQP